MMAALDVLRDGHPRSLLPLPPDARVGASRSNPPMLLPPRIRAARRKPFPPAPAPTTSTMTQMPSRPADAATAEREALRRQEAEAHAEQRFDAVHAALAADGRIDEATRSREFHEWMATRTETDVAWGRWAVAMDAENA